MPVDERGRLVKCRKFDASSVSDTVLWHPGSRDRYRSIIFQESARKLLSKGYNKNGGELKMYSLDVDELTERTRAQNRDMIHDSMIARTPVSSGARRFSEGTYYPGRIT